METIVKLISGDNPANALYGPWIPIYGIGSCVIIFIMRLVFNRIKAKRFIKIILFFIISTLTLTLLEYTGGVLMEYFTGKVMWDYSNLKFHIGKYIALEISLVWGILSLVLIYLIKPKIDKLIIKIPKIITYFMFLIIIFDITISIFNPK